MTAEKRIICFKMIKNNIMYRVFEKESTSQVVLDNFQQQTTRIKIKNDLESKKLTLYHTKNLVICKGMNSKTQGLLKRSCATRVHILKYTIFKGL